MNQAVTTISYLTNIVFGHGAIRQLRDELAAVGIKRPMLVTDRGVVAAGIAGRVLETLPQGNSMTCFEDTPGNPTEEAVLKALVVYREGKCDGLVAVGGGSSMDLAKAVAVLSAHPEPLMQYTAVAGGTAKITSAVAPVIAVPTTAGTGSEVGRGFVITFSDGQKLACISPNLFPKRAVCDPELTVGLPPAVTAGTGMDAFTHCVESLLSPRVNPPAEAIALDGIERAAKWIERAVADGSDREARWNMMMAALEGGLAFQKGLGAVHAMSHPLGSLKKPVLHHGTLNAVILPAVLRFNKDHVGDKYTRIRAALKLKEGANLADHVAKLNARIGLPPNLRAMGVTADVLPRMVKGAIKDHCTATNPRPAGERDYEALFVEAMA